MKTKKSSYTTMKEAGKEPVTCWPTAEEKSVILRAAKADGRSMADFIIRAAMRAAMKNP